MSRVKEKEWNTDDWGDPLYLGLTRELQHFYELNGFAIHGNGPDLTKANRHFKRLVIFDWMTEKHGLPPLLETIKMLQKVPHD